MNQIFEFFTKLNAGQKAVIIGALSIFLIFLLFIIVYTKSSKSANANHTYIIAKDLSKNKIMAASSELDSLAIPFSIVGDGDNMSLKTSKEFINIAKIKLVASGALKGDHKGWEIFDKSSIGETTFQNKIKYIRAIEGELARSLEALSHIRKASVRVVLPKDSIFTDKKSHATASAILTLEPGRYLTSSQIKGIKRFISSAIQDLEPSRVQLIDQNGELLEDADRGYDGQKFKNQVQYKQNLQNSLEKSVISLLEPVMGSGAVVAKVNVQLDFTKQDKAEETFSPEGTPRSRQSDETTTNESSSSASDGKASSNNLGSKAGGGSSKNNEHIVTTTNYEISKVVTNTTNKAYANIKRITAAVTFDDKVLKNIENPQTYIVNIEDLVKDAIGFKKSREDKITVKSFKFAAVEAAPPEVDTTVPTVKYYLNEFGPYIKYLVVIALLFIVYKKFASFTPATVPAASGAAHGGTQAPSGAPGGGEPAIAQFGAEEEVAGMQNLKAKQMRTKQEIQSKVQDQLSALDNLDAESKAKFETLAGQLNSDVTSNPEEIANMVELLLEDEVGNS